MKLERPIMFLDTETTGTDPQQDRIIEIAMVALLPGRNRLRWQQRFNPRTPIPATATAVHGISDQDVAGMPPFSEFAAKIATALTGKDLAGYNLRRFDLPILDEELRRCGRRLSLDGVLVIDCYGIYAKKEPRNLEAAVKRFLKRDHSGAHGAMADAEASLDVFEQQILEYEDLAQMDMPAIAEYSLTGEHRPADIAGKLYYDEEKRLRFGFGKNRDKLVRDEQDYADWMVRKGQFPGSTIEVLKQEMGWR